MALRIDKTFSVQAAWGSVWAFLTDPYRVARCLPGAQVTEQLDDKTYAGTVTVKVGPVTATYKGKLRFERLDAAERTAELVASGQDVRGKGGAEVRMTSRLAEQASGATEVAVSSDVNVTGMLAQFGRGMIDDVGDQMFQKFTEAVRAELESARSGIGLASAPPPGARNEVVPLDVVSLGAGVVSRAAARAARQPALWVAVPILALVLYWLWLR
jgi:carbon monoxide dehydrogenase subunit G